MKQSGRQIMSEQSESNGFTTIELLITLFIAAAFLVSGYQLYNLIIKDGGETRAQTRAGNVAYDYLQRYKPSATTPCKAQTPLTNAAPNPVPVNLSNVTVTVQITCPYGITSSVSKVQVNLSYGNPQQTISNATYVSYPGLVTNGLIMNLDAGSRRSIINWDSWTVGAGGATGYSVNGTSNSRIIDTNPWGVSDIVWDSYGYDAAGPNGGWNGSSFPIDNTKMYRFSTWVRRETIGTGSFYLGTHGYPDAVLNRSNAASNSNPYFSATGWWGNVNQWYLVVGYVWPAGSGTGATMPQSGIYALDGTKIASNSDYIWQPTTTSSNHRSYLFYSGDPATNQQWYQPRVDIIDGTEPTVTELLNNAENTWVDSSGNENNGVLNGPGVIYNSANGGSLVFDGVSGGKISALNNFGTLSNYTISFWAKNNVANKMPIASGISTSFYWYGDNSWRYTHGGTGAEYYYPKSVNIPYGTWGNFCVSYNGSNVSIYRNGVFEGSKASTGTANFSSGFMLGNWNGGSGYMFNGSISVVNLYNRALSATDIQQNFNALRSRYGV